MKRSISLRLALAACLLAAPGFVMVAHAATRTWTGTASGAWTNAANWGGTAPVAGDDLVFPEGASNTTNANDFAAGTSFSSIAVNGAYTISGNAATLTAAGALTFQSTVPASSAFTVPVTLANASVVIATPQSDPVSLNVTLGPVTIGAGALSLAIVGNSTQVYFTGAIGETSTASITKSGNGVAYFNASNTYSGQTIVNQGYVGVGANGGLGVGTNSAADGTVVNPGGSLFLNGAVAVANERVVLNGVGQSGNGAFQTNSGNSAWGGDIVLNTPNIAFNLLGTSLTISGRITGSGDFQFGRSTVILTNPLNDYAGATVIGYPAGGTTTLRLGASEVIPNDSAVQILAGATLDHNGNNETIASLSGAGPVDLKLGQITIAGNASTTFDGIFIGNGAVNKWGTGSLTLNGNSNISPLAIHINAGTVVVNGHIGPNVYVSSATLMGTGGVGFTQAFPGGGATIAPGAGSPGALGAISLILPAGNTLAIRLNGVSAGTQYDQLRVSGSPSSSLISLGGTLSVSLGFAPLVGTVFRIIDNLSPGPTGGSFAGLPEGAIFTVGATQLRISYVGGNGNDVTLTVVPAAPPAPSITTTSPLPGTTAGTAYSTTIAGGGGTPPYTWSVTSGALPGGLTLDPATGALTGTPTAAGTFNFTVTLTDNAAQTATRAFTLVVAAAPPPVPTQPVPALGPWTLALLALLTALGGVLASRRRSQAVCRQRIDTRRNV